MKLLRVIILSLFFLVTAHLGYAQKIDPNAKPFKISGSLGGSFNYYNMQGVTQRRLPYGYSLFGSVNLKLYGWSLPFSVAISQQGTAFSHPFSRYGVSPEYKWIKLYLGYRNMRFSEFTLNGITFLGAGVELTPGKFRFSAMYGQLRKAINEPKNQFEIPQYQRKGYGAKIGYGKKTFIDLSFFTAKDELGTLTVPDSIRIRNKPEASTSLGLSGNVSMAKNKLNFNYDAAMSTYTYDLKADPVSTESSTKKYIDYLSINTSSNAAFAGLAGLQYKNKGYSIGLKYRYVQPGFRTLGANYILSDLEMYTVNAGAQLLKKRMSINGSYGIQKNNLSTKRFAKTGRNIGSLAINYRATDKLTFNLSYSNFSIYQTVIRDNLFADSILVDQTNHLANLGVMYVVAANGRVHSYSLNGTFQELADQRQSPTYNIGNQLYSIIGTYSVRFNKRNFGLSFGANYQDFSSLLATQKRYGGNASITKQVLKKKMKLRLRQVWNRSILDIGNDDIFNTQFSLNYAFTKKQSITSNIGLISRTGKNSFNEWTFSVGYRTRF